MRGPDNNATASFAPRAPSFAAGKETETMMLRNKTAIIYGAGGSVGSAVARAFAREGATVFLSGRRRASVETVAKEITAAGGTARAAEVDALDERAVEAHLAAVVAEAGRVDVSFNAIGIAQVGIQGIPLVALPLASFALPIETYTRAHFLTARAAARVMTKAGGGVILVHTPSPARSGTPLVGGMALAWASLEALTQTLSAELGAQGVRAVCLRTTGLPETPTIDVVYGLHAEALGIQPAQFRALIESRTHRQRSNTLAEVADAAVFAASDRGAALTGTTVNLTGGLVVD
jgi:NAD(P)-dependent dehydrogenase (short-subunit alcohol dehydrogenase family)